MRIFAQLFWRTTRRGQLSSWLFFNRPKQTQKKFTIMNHTFLLTFSSLPAKRSVWVGVNCSRKFLVNSGLVSRVLSRWLVSEKLGLSLWGVTEKQRTGNVFTWIFSTIFFSLFSNGDCVGVWITEAKEQARRESYAVPLVYFDVKKRIIYIFTVIIVNFRVRCPVAGQIDWLMWSKNSN